ncbi:MAG: 4Fe-4S binding protein [Gemmatimonadota bacterium]|nr:4Fe-4S binding protein [Gemmatimonadota bacterium]MDH4350068.1 4Fe-4S binding protein [Gemmatimonadota bacterium]MDH5198289.1 4Fe-4S binding protein [Gemmatimonadota bacterium]
MRVVGACGGINAEGNAMVALVVVPAVAVLGLVGFWLTGERGHLLLPSTRHALRERRDGRPGTGARAGLVTALHGYIYGRWTEQYIRVFRSVLPWMTPTMKRRWADGYHGKIVPTEHACAIVRLDHDITRTDLEHVIPYPRARDILLKGPLSVTLLECPCRLGKPDHCEPTQVCMLVGGGDFALDHHPAKARRVTQAEALQVLHDEHARGHVHTAYFKDAVDNRFYAICNCCSCCCGGLEAMRFGVPMVASSGFVAEVDEGACIGCGDCETACPFGAVHVPYRAEVSWDDCMGCGVCEGPCSTGAIQLVRDERKGVPLDVRSLA